MIARRTLGAALAGIAALAAVTTVAPSPAQAADDWRKQVPVFRVGILGGENEADRLKNYACFKDIMSERLGIPVELYPASDYAGVMQGLISKNLEYAGLGSSGYAGGHEQGVVAVLNNQYDAGVTWTSGVGDYNKGYSAGNLAKMVEKGALDMKDIRILWTSSLISNGQNVVRKDLPQELKDTVRGALVEKIGRASGREQVG